MRDRGEIELLELIAKDPQAFILKQGWALVSLNGDHGLKELRSLYEHLQARILEMIATLDDLRASGDYQVFQAAEKDEAVIVQIISAQRVELEQEIAGLETEAERVAEAGVAVEVAAVPQVVARHFQQAASVQRIAYLFAYA